MERVAARLTLRCLPFTAPLYLSIPRHVPAPYYCTRATLLVLAYASLAFQTTVRRGIHHGMRALRQVEQAEEAERQRSRPAGVGDADEARAGSRGVPSGDLLPHGRSRDS